MDRRQFIKLGMTGAVVVASGSMLAGCASPAPEQSNLDPHQPENAAATAEPAIDAAPPEPSTDAATGSMIVIYYSHPETTASSDPANLNEAEDNSAVVIDGEILGNTQYVAQVIARETGADLHRIEIGHEYPVDHQALIDQAQQEQNSGFRPEIIGGIPDLAVYDIVFFGHPIWWAELPPAVMAFLEQADFAGKDVYLFNTHGGSGDAGTPATIRSLQPEANISEDNYVVSRSMAAEAEPEIAAWARGLGFSSQS